MRSRSLSFRTSAREEILLVTPQVEAALGELAPGGAGICTLFTPHTTTALTINEDADPDVRTDLLRALKALVPDVRFDHGEGNSDAHLLSTLIGVSVQIPYREGRLLLGRWQGVWLVELDGPRTREVALHVP
ncbi:MAG TPA: secondary thiamine-phosphate synthase enzyme YjbQ [Thermoanaerobaculia bacterium]|nr:secondary thiamine-phosphate synthase enzyme YjbQ [Thermoanaerobaculia bacterium]